MQVSATHVDWFGPPQAVVKELAGHAAQMPAHGRAPLAHDVAMQ